MMEAEIYGIMPSEKITAELRLPPENVDTKPST